jgi:hypothetical protein
VSDQVPNYDHDLPSDVRAELMSCAVSNGRINYYWLCELWRKGHRAGEADTVARLERVRLADE